MQPFLTCWCHRYILYWNDTIKTKTRFFFLKKKVLNGWCQKSYCIILPKLSHRNCGKNKLYFLFIYTLIHPWLSMTMILLMIVFIHTSLVTKKSSIPLSNCFFVYIFCFYNTYWNKKYGIYIPESWQVITFYTKIVSLILNYWQNILYYITEREFY